MGKKIREYYKLTKHRVTFAEYFLPGQELIKQPLFAPLGSWPQDQEDINKFDNRAKTKLKLTIKPNLKLSFKSEMK